MPVDLLARATPKGAMQGSTAYMGKEALANLLDWWELAGVDTLVADTPRDWLVADAIAPRAASPAPRTNTPQAIAELAPRPEPAALALPERLEDLVAWLGDAANFKMLGPRRCPPQGQPGAALMLMSDIPDPNDLDAGALFSGEAGQLLDAMLRAIGQSRDSLYLASIAPGRPAAGRIDEPLAMALAPVARRHVALAGPNMLLMMGEASVRTLLGTGLAEARGRVHEIDLGDGRSVKAVASFHPRFLLQQPARKADAWADLKLMMSALA